MHELGSPIWPMKVNDKHMNRKFFEWGILFLLFVWGLNLQAQTLEEQKFLDQKLKMADGKVFGADSLKVDEQDALQLFDNTPSFGVYRDNYFVTGVPTNYKINKNTADAKFQISIRQRLTKSILPFKTFLYLTYTQKSFWDIYRKSSPFQDNNFNPGISLSKAIIHHNTLKGIAVFSFEHESNGRDSLQSRSWNYLSLSGSWFFNARFSVQLKVWGGWVDQEGNPDLLKYRGYGLVALNYKSMNERWWCSLVINPRRRFIDMNTIWEVNYKPFRKANEYLFLQFYNGYGENLLEYNRFSSMVRLGICIKPFLLNYY